MRPLPKLLLPLALCGFAGAAQAQFLGRSWETNVTLTQGDLDMIKAALAQQIHGKPAGATAGWENPQSGNSGTITLVKILPRGAMHCEQIQYVQRPPEPTKPFDRFVMTSCRQPDGSWRLSE